jgi:hypothetical protein
MKEKKKVLNMYVYTCSFTAFTAVLAEFIKIKVTRILIFGNYVPYVKFNSNTFHQGLRFTVFTTLGNMQQHHCPHKL